MSKLSFKRVDDELRAAGRVRGVDPAPADARARSTIRSRGNDTTNVRLRAGLDVGDHERVGVAARVAGLRRPNASSSSGVDDELPGVAPDDQEVRTLRRHLRGDQLDALDLLDPVSISWLTLATAAVVTDVASTSAMRKRPVKARTVERETADMRCSLGSGGLARSAARWRGGSRYWHASSGETGTVVGVEAVSFGADEPTPLNPGPRTRTTSPPTVPSAASSAPCTVPATSWAFASSPGR